MKVRLIPNDATIWGVAGVNAGTERSDVIERMLAGVRGFHRRWYERRPEEMRRLVEEGQKPDALVIGCCDSRVDPAILTRAEPGQLFVVRNIANLVPPPQADGGCHGTSAAIEYAVTTLEVRHIVVLGHARCGGIDGLIRSRRTGDSAGAYVAPWVSAAAAACEAELSAAFPDPRAVERAAIRGSIANLGAFPFVRDRVADGRLTLHGWWFDLESGALWVLDPASGRFAPIDGGDAKAVDRGPDGP